MKKAIAIILTLVIVLGCVAGCSSKPVERSGKWVCNAIDGVEESQYVVCVSKNIPDGQELLTEINKVIDSLDVDDVLKQYMSYGDRRNTIGITLRDLFLTINELRDKEGDDPVIIYSQVLDPFDFSGAAGAFADGIDMLISEQAAVNLGRSAVLYERTYSYGYEQVKSGKGDIFATGVVLTEQVKNDFLVSKVYTTGKQQIVSDKNEAYTKLSQLKGKVIGVITGRTSEIIVNKELAGSAEIVAFETDTEAKTALYNQRVDVLVVDEMPAKLLVDRLNNGK
ncbi:MAG: transporter substrate-binding domain-containing protein [Clostridia bacterium]|nr:transporter substrate-binding domain-containing protein [Clostridia bacterium]